MNDDDYDPEQKKTGDLEPYVSDVLQSLGIRCSVQNGIRYNRFLLDYSINFLPCCSFIFWIIFLFIGI